MHLVHLLASPFFGGPERQALGLAQALTPDCRTTFLSFAERGLARPFLDRARAQGFEAIELQSNFPRVGRAIDEVARHLQKLQTDLLCTSGYKPDILGWRAGRQAGVPVVAIAHGWTGVTFKVRLYEAIDAWVMRRLDAVVCVSEAMAGRLRAAGVPQTKLHVIRNAIDARAFEHPCPDSRQNIESFFERPPALIVGAAGRLSPEKGFDVLITAAALVCRQRNDVGFLLFGEGPLRPALEELIEGYGLQGRVVLGGFRDDLDKLLPGLDLFVLSSHTEGLPVAVLEAQAAAVPVVATAVGGTPEVILEGVTGYLVPPAQEDPLAVKILQALSTDEKRREMGRQAAHRVREEFTFAVQAARYRALFNQLTAERRGHVCA